MTTNVVRSTTGPMEVVRSEGKNSGVGWDPRVKTTTTLLVVCCEQRWGGEKDEGVEIDGSGG